MNIAFLNLAGPNFPGGCEKYFAMLARFFSEKYSVSFISSKEYVLFMEFVYSILTNHKIGSIQYIKRDVGTTTVVNLNLISIIFPTDLHDRIKKILHGSDSVYVKNEFQDLLVTYLLLGREAFTEKVIIGVHSAIFIPEEVRGFWKVIHDIQYNSFLYRKFLQNARSIHVPNSDYVELISEHYQINKRKISYIPHPIEWDTLYSKQQKKESFKVLWAGRFTKQKGLDNLKKILIQLSKNKHFRSMDILIAGNGEEYPKVKEMIEKYSNVTYLGFVEDMSALYKKIDVVILTSYFEVLPYSILEPQSFGIPVVSMNIMGAKDIIKDKETGYLVNDSEDFSRKLIFLYELKKKHPNEYDKMKRKTFIATSEKFSKPKILKKIKSLFVSE